MVNTRGISAAFLGAAATISGMVIPAWGADKAAIAEVRGAWDACSSMRSGDPDGWIGWRHDFGNGYGNSFQFWDNRLAGAPSLLQRTFMIDAIAIETVTSCFRGDGSLAFVYVTMDSPNMAGQDGLGAEIQRQGRIYVAPDGTVLDVLGRIVDLEGTKLGFLDDEKLMLARGCGGVDLHFSADDAETQYFATLGDIEGNRPTYQEHQFDWCAEAREQN